jgi:hypothetical protein
MDWNLDNMTPEERTRIDNLAWLPIPIALLRIVNSQVDSGEDSPNREGTVGDLCFLSPHVRGFITVVVPELI